MSESKQMYEGGTCQELAGGELKPFSCTQIQDHLRFIDFTSVRESCACKFFL